MSGSPGSFGNGQQHQRTSLLSFGLEGERGGGYEGIVKVIEEEKFQYRIMQKLGKLTFTTLLKVHSTGLKSGLVSRV